MDAAAGSAGAIVPVRPGARLTVALGLSLVAHAALLLLIRAKPPEWPAAGVPSAPITARLSEPHDAEPAVAATALPTPEAGEPAVPAVDLVPPPRADERIPEKMPEREPQAPERTPERAAPSRPHPEPSAGIEVPIFRDPTYYTAKQLDEYPRPLAAIELRYPRRAAEANVGGKVMLLLLIDETGRVDEVSVVEATPAGWFEEAAIEAFREVRFAPGKRAGRAVKSRVLITVGYDPEKPAPAQ